MSSNLARVLNESTTPETPVPIIPTEDLKRYAELKAKAKEIDNEVKLLNVRIKDALGKFLLETNQAALSEHQPLVDEYECLCSDLAWMQETGLEDEKKPAIEARLQALTSELATYGITTQMIYDAQDGDTARLLKKTPVNITLDGYKVSTSIQDRSTLDQDRAVAYLKSQGLTDLITTKEVVDETALEVAIYNQQVDAAALKKMAVTENFVVALTVKAPKESTKGAKL